MMTHQRQCISTCTRTHISNRTGGSSCLMLMSSPKLPPKRHACCTTVADAEQLQFPVGRHESCERHANFLLVTKVIIIISPWIAVITRLTSIAQFVVGLGVIVSLRLVLVDVPQR